jgi:ATP-dependent Clp protease ATP-binding subunit ClpA
MAHTGLVQCKGPLSVFLFLGPTGVGKTETARCIAEFLFGSEADLIRLDMTEYMEEHSVAKLIGSPPGYVGYDEEGQLTGKLRTKPYSIVLLDEIEKAHPKVFDIFLQVFDDGRLTDSKGRTIDAKNAIFIMTSNIYVSKQPELGFVPSREKYEQNQVFKEVTRVFSPEFINRIDDQVVFYPLSEDSVRKILSPILNGICQNLQSKYKISLQIEEESEVFLARAGYSKQYGARELRREVERQIQIPLSRAILDRSLVQHKEWKLHYQDEKLELIPLD